MYCPIIIHLKHTKMKTKNLLMVLIIAFSAMIFNSCSKDDETIDVFYSDWFTGAWVGSSGYWDFEVAAPAVTQAIIDQGTILAYTKLVGDGNVIRPLPATLGTGIWNYLIVEPGTLRFTTNATGTPSNDNEFRYVVIKGNKALKSAGMGAESLKSMSYEEVCDLLNIPK